MIMVRTLVGLSQFTWTWAMASPASVKGEVADARLARRRSGRPLGRHGDRCAIVGQDEVEDRQVVGGEVPEDVDVRLHQPEVDAHRVDELDVAELAADAPSSRMCCTAGV